MTDLTLPLLSVPDVVVLPGMVVPIELDADTRPVVDAAQAAARDDEPGQLLLAPRLSDRYPTHGVVATIEQVGRLPGGVKAAVLRAGERVRIGSGVPGAGVPPRPKVNWELPQCRFAKNRSTVNCWPAARPSLVRSNVAFCRAGGEFCCGMRACCLARYTTGALAPEMCRFVCPAAEAELKPVFHLPHAFAHT